jgi:pimeloyl-ACP methyl ester carboxylesterase
MTYPDWLDHPLISERYFFPRREAVADPFPIEVAGATLACRRYLVDPQAKTLVHFHGNGEVAADYERGFPELFTRLGCNLLLAEFRGYGGSTGRPQLGRMLADVATVLAAAGPPETLVLFGRSVGSLFAIQGVKLFPQVAGLILESGIADVRERLLLRVAPEELGVAPEILDTDLVRVFDHRQTLANYRNPLLVLHTRHDGLVDVSHGERLHRWAAGKKTLTVFPRGDHNSILSQNADRYAELVTRFLQGVGCQTPG